MSVLYSMKKYYVYKNFVKEFFAIFLSVAVFLIGCSKSADDLYTEGKFLINKKETLEKGLEKLIKFEKKFPQDNRMPEVILTIASLYQYQKNYDEAASTFERLIDNYPHSPEAYKGKFLLGYMYYDDLNDSEKAVEVLNDFITAYPDSELAVSAKVLLENIDLPVEEWPIVKELGSINPKENDSQVSK